MVDFEDDDLHFKFRNMKKINAFRKGFIRFVKVFLLISTGQFSKLFEIDIGNSTRDTSIGSFEFFFRDFIKKKPKYVRPSTKTAF